MNSSSTTPERGKNNHIEVVKITFHDMPDFVFSTEQWKGEGGYRGIIKQGIVSIKEIKKVIYGTTMSYNKFIQLPAWEG